MKISNLSLAATAIIFGGLSSVSASNDLDYDDTSRFSQLSLQDPMHPHHGELPKPDFSNLTSKIDDSAPVCPPTPARQTQFIDLDAMDPNTPTRRRLF